MFVLNSDITIGNFRFSGVNEVKVTRSMHNFTDTAIIKIPRKGMVLKGKDIRQVTIPEIINDDDKVSISLGYNGEMRTEFEGFVVRRNIDTPMEIECEGYVRQLRQKVDITKKYKKTSAKELLELIVSKTEIKVHVADDLPLEQVEFTHANGIDICNKIQELSQRTLTIFFINPQELWCGFTYSPILPAATHAIMARRVIKLGSTV